MKNDDTLLPPMQVGQNAEESERLVEEIQQTGVVESQDAAQNAPSPDENMAEGTESPSIPTPIIARS